MQKTILQVPITKQLKTDAEKAAISQGFSSLQEIIRIFLSQLAEKKVEISLQKANQLPAKSEKSYLNMIKNIENNKQVYMVNDPKDIMKKLIAKKVLEYTAIFEPAEEGGYVASVPALPGCLTQGDTFEDAIEMIKDAIQGYIQVLKEEGQEIPEEKSETVITKVSITNPILSL